MITEWINIAAARHGSAVYLEDGAGTRSVTYAGLREAAAAWAACLDEAGVPAGAAVALRLPDPVDYATALVAIIGAGRVVVPLDPAAPGADLERMLAVAVPQIVVGDPDASLRPGLTVINPPDPLTTAGGVLPSGLSSSGGIFLCTSGTTGTPKGILLRDDQLAHTAGAVAVHHRLKPSDRGYCCLPLFHINAEVVGLLGTLAAGGCLVLERKFSRRNFWPLIESRRITWINAVPAIITLLAMDQAGASRPGGRVRFVRSASAPLAPAVLERFEASFGIPVVETYGMTEAASMITANPLDGVRKPGSAGRPAGTEVRVVPPAGAAGGGPDVIGPDVIGPGVIGPGVIGRVQIRGRGVITHYAANGRPGAIGADGWLDTGDLGYLDQDGYLFLAGRSDDVINRGGEKIYPREIEDFLLGQDGVSSVAVVAAHDDVLGERPVAYVVPAGSWPPDDLEDTLRQACELGLPRPKRPSSFSIVPELPLGPTGKIARRQLKELAMTPA